MFADSVFPALGSAPVLTKRAQKKEAERFAKEEDERMLREAIAHAVAAKEYHLDLVQKAEYVFYYASQIAFRESQDRYWKMVEEREAARIAALTPAQRRAEADAIKRAAKEKKKYIAKIQKEWDAMEKEALQKAQAKKDFYLRHKDQIDFHVDALKEAIFPKAEWNALYVMSFYEKELPALVELHSRKVPKNLKKAVLEHFDEYAKDRCSEDEYEDLCLDWYDECWDRDCGIKPQPNPENAVRLAKSMERTFARLLGVMGDFYSNSAEDSMGRMMTSFLDTMEEFAEYD
jgi:hypothetical protein